MADEPVSPPAVVPPSAAAQGAPEPVAPLPVPAAPAPVVAAPEPAPAPVVVTPEPAKIVEAVKPVEPVKAPEQTKVEAKAEEPAKPHTETETLLEGAKPKEEPKVDDKKVEAKSEEKKPEPTLAETPKIEFKPWVPPEGVKLDNARVAELNDLIVKDMPPQDRRDALLAKHVAEMQAYADHLSREQHRVFSDTRAQWRKEAQTDEEMGGSGWQTSLNTIAQMRDLFVPEAKREAFNNMLRITGAGDHPEFLRFLYNVGRKFSEPAAPPVAYQPPPDIGRAPPARGRAGKASVMYDNPRSHNNRS